MDKICPCERLVIHRRSEDTGGAAGIPQGKISKEWGIQESPSLFRSKVQNTAPICFVNHSYTAIQHRQASRSNRRNTSSNRATWRYKDPNTEQPNRSVFRCVLPQTPVSLLDSYSDGQPNRWPGETPKSRAWSVPTLTGPAAWTSQAGNPREAARSARLPAAEQKRIQQVPT